MYVGVARTVGGGVSRSFRGTVVVVMIGVSRIIFAHVVMAPVRVVWSFGVIAGSVWIMRVPRGSTRVGRGVSPGGVSVLMPVVVVMVWPSGGRGGGSCGGRRGSGWWWLYWTVVWYFAPLCALFRP